MIAALVTVAKGIGFGLALAGSYAGGALLRGRARVLSGRARHVRRPLRRLAKKGR